MTCVKPVKTSHLEVFFGDMLNTEGKELYDMNGLFNIGVIFVFIVMEGHIVTIVGINAGSGNNRMSKVAADIFDNRIRITEIGFGIDIEVIFIFF